jgi:hypothetical protein
VEAVLIAGLFMSWIGRDCIYKLSLKQAETGNAE